MGPIASFSRFPCEREPAQWNNMSNWFLLNSDVGDLLNTGNFGDEVGSVQGFGQVLDRGS